MTDDVNITRALVLDGGEKILNPQVEEGRACGRLGGAYADNPYRKYLGSGVRLTQSAENTYAQYASDWDRGFGAGKHTRQPQPAYRPERGTTATATTNQEE